MLSFIGRSIIQKIVTLFFVSIVSFLIVYLAPGKPSQVDPLNPKFTPEIVERFRKAFHLDKPLHIQYFYYYRDLFTGRTVSWKDNQPVLSKIWELQRPVHGQNRILERQPAGAFKDMGTVSEQPSPVPCGNDHHLDSLLPDRHSRSHF